MLQQQDIILACYLIWYGSNNPTDQGSKPDALTHCVLTEIDLLESLERLIQCKLLSELSGRVFTANFLDVIKAIPYIWPGKQSIEASYGIPTCIEADFGLHPNITPRTVPFVWRCDITGGTVGTPVEPLHASAPIIARRGQEMYVWLALIDCLRYGRAREKEFSLRHIKDIITFYNEQISHDMFDKNMLENILN